MQSLTATMRMAIGALIVLSLLPLPVTAQQGTSLQAGAQIGHPPFSFTDRQGRIDGFSVELLRYAARAMGYDVRVQADEWALVKGWLRDGNVDVLPLVARTPERAEWFEFSFPYLTLYGCIVVREEEQSIETVSDLRGRRVAVMAADSAEAYLHRLPWMEAIEIHSAPTSALALRKLAEGHVDAAVMTRFVAMHLLAGMEGHRLRIADRPLMDLRYDYAFAVRQNDTKRLALLNEGLARVIMDGTYRRLYAKWFAALERPGDRRIIVGGGSQLSTV